MKIITLFLAFFFFSLSGLQAQVDIDPSMAGTVHFDMTGFPQWSRDLRRASIIAFGSFPFMYLFANFAYDSGRLAANSWDMRYAPWPFNSAGTIEKTQGEKFLTIGIAAGSAVIIALVDQAIMLSRRNRQERESRNLPDGSPIIIRRPLHDDESEIISLEFPETETPVEDQWISDR